MTKLFALLLVFFFVCFATASLFGFLIQGAVWLLEKITGEKYGPL